MRLRDPPKKGWKYGKTGWQVYIWSIFLVPTALLVVLHLIFPSFLDTFTLVLLLIVAPLSALWGAVDFTRKKEAVEEGQGQLASKGTIGNVLVTIWAVGIGTLIGSMYSFLVLSNEGLKVPYVSLTALVFLIAVVVAIGFVFLGRKLLSRPRT